MKLFELDAVIDFYEKAINAIEKMSRKEVRNTDFKFLIEIDDNVAEKYRGYINFKNYDKFSREY